MATAPPSRLALLVVVAHSRRAWGGHSQGVVHSQAARSGGSQVVVRSHGVVLASNLAAVRGHIAADSLAERPMALSGLQSWAVQMSQAGSDRGAAHAAKC